MSDLTDDAIAVIVLNWNSHKDTTRCVESLLSLNRDVGVIICDNASTDNSVDHFRAWAARELPLLNAGRSRDGRRAFSFIEAGPSDAENGAHELPLKAAGNGTITLIQTGANLGYAGGNNAGLRHAYAQSYDYFWVINNDTWVLPDSLEHAHRRMSADPDIGLCGSTLVYMDRPDLVQCLGGGTFNALTGRAGQIGWGRRLSNPIDGDAVEHRMRYVSGAATLVSRPFLRDIGFMDEGYFLFFEELDWARRAVGKYRLGYAPKSILHHKVGGTIGTNDRGQPSAVADYYFTRSRIRFCRTHSQMSLPFVGLDVLRSAIWWLVRGRPERALIIIHAALGMSFRGEN
jgi:GT2 family glycosyltransferase